MYNVFCDGFVWGGCSLSTVREFQSVVSLNASKKKKKDFEHLCACVKNGFTAFDGPFFFHV